MYRKTSQSYKFYSHASCEARHTGKLLGNVDFIISTHPPLARRDIWEDITNAAELDFYSHAPCGARHYTNFFWHIICISTHTPHAGRDLNVSNKTVWAWDFYSHAPCGARRSSASADCISFQFLLTRPMRGATITCLIITLCFIISTHTPLARRDGRNRAWK